MDNIIQELLTLLQNKYTTYYKKYVYGEFVLAPRSYFPMIEVVPVSTEVVNRGTGGNTDNEFRVKIQVKDTLKNTFEKADSVRIDALYNMVQGIEPRTVNGDFASTGIMHLLKNNLQLSGKAEILDNFIINYETLYNDEGYTIIGTIEFACRKITL